MSGSRDSLGINFKIRFSSQQMSCLYEKQLQRKVLQIVSHIQFFN